MLMTSHYLQAGAPTCCCFCGCGFKTIEGHMQAWRTSTGQYYCSEFCAEDAAESAFRRRKSN
jgi:hypothetical protein